MIVNLSYFSACTSGQEIKVFSIQINKLSYTHYCFFKNSNNFRICWQCNATFAFKSLDAAWKRTSTTALFGIVFKIFWRSKDLWIGPIGYLIIEPNHIKVHNATKEKTSRRKTKYPNNYLRKDWSKRWKISHKIAVSWKL